MLEIPIKSGYFRPTTLDLMIWEVAYPEIHVSQTLAQIASWNHSQAPHRRKTESGIRRHIDTWLARANQQAVERRERHEWQYRYQRDWARAAVGR